MQNMYHKFCNCEMKHGIKMSQKTVKQSLTCRTCTTNFATVKEMNEHQFSLMHHIRLDQAKKGTVLHSCCLCSLSIGGLKNYVAHLDGKKHKANLAKFRTSGINSVRKNKTNNKQEKSGSLKVSKPNKQAIKNSNQNREVSSPIAKSNNNNAMSYSNTGNDHIPVCVTPHTNNNSDINRTMQHCTEFDNNDYSSDNYFGGWNFSNMEYHNYSQFPYEIDNWDQQNYNDYWCNQQSSWRSSQWNVYPQEDCTNFQHSNNVNNYGSTQHNHYGNYNNSSSDTFNGTYSSKENYNNNKSDRFRWYRSADEKFISPQNSKYDKSSVSYENNQTAYTVNSINKYEKNLRNDFNEHKYSINPKRKTKYGNGDLPLSRTSYNKNFPVKTKSNYSNCSNTKCDIENVKKPKDNSNLSIKEQKLLKQKSKLVVNKSKLKLKPAKLNFPQKNIKASKVTGQRYISRWNRTNSLYNNMKSSTEAQINENKYLSVESSAVAVTEDLNHVKITLQDAKIESDKKENTEKSYSKKQKLDETSNIHHSMKLHKLSQILEESKVEFCPFDKELINKLVNFPRSRKEQLQLGRWIQEHSRTKKKLTLPRFNLQLVSSQNVKNQSEDSSAFLHSVVSEVVNNLQENVIDSLLLAIKNAEGDIMQNVAEDNTEGNCTENQKSSVIKIQQNKDHLINLHSEQLTHAEKIQWLQNWITEACKPQNVPVSQKIKTGIDQSKDIGTVQDTEGSFLHSTEVQTENADHSFQSTNVNKLNFSSERLLSDDDNFKESSLPTQNDSDRTSYKEDQNESILQEVPVNSITVKQEVLSENDDSGWSTETVRFENNNDTNEVSMSPFCNLQNVKSPPSIQEIEHQTSGVRKYTSNSNSSTQECDITRKHTSNSNSSTQECDTTRKQTQTSHCNVSLSSDVCGKVPSDIQNADLLHENQSLSNVTIKTEIEDIHDDEAVKVHKLSCNQNINTNCNEMDSEKISCNNRNERLQSGSSIDSASLDGMINTFAAGSFCKDNPSTMINNVKDMLNKNKTLLEQITELLNSHMEHSNMTDLSNENLVQEILSTSQKEEELRLLGSKIDRIISYFIRFGKEWKEKRTQAFYEEMKLRTRRIQLLERLKGQLPTKQNSFSKVECDSSSHVPASSKSKTASASLHQLNIDEHHSENKTLTHNHSMLSGSIMSENRSQKFPDFIDELSSHSQVCSTENNLKYQNSCASNSNNKDIKGKKRKNLSSNNNSTMSLDPTNNQTANLNSDNETNLLKRIKLATNPMSVEGTGTFKYRTRTLAEENERFWKEMEMWLQDMEHNSQASENQEYSRQENESEIEKCPEHIYTPPSAESSVQHINDTSSCQESLLKEPAFAASHVDAHKLPVLDIKVYGDYLYSCSSDTTAKRFDLEHPSNVILFNGHQKTVTSLQVIDLGSNNVQVFTSCMDGFLRCFDNNSGHCLNEVKIGFPIICMAEGWGKLYLGLPTGIIAVYSLKAKKVTDYFQCSKFAISNIATSTEGALKILCVASYDSTVTVWDALTGLLLRCLEGQANPPCKVKIAGEMVYTSTTKKTVLIHSLSSGKLLKVLNWPVSATDLHVTENYIISCSFDGMVRCYTKKEWILHAAYYGAGESSVLCMCVHNDWIFTGSRHGLIGAFKFNPLFVVQCQFGKCYLRFGRLEDLKHHLKNCHFPKIDNKLQLCAWRGCDVQFTPKTTNQEKEDHTLQHIKSS